jgi:hypothetical protein
MAANAFFQEVGTFYRGLQVVTVTFLFATAIFSFVAVLYVGIDPVVLPWTTLKGTGLIVLLVVPLLAARVLVPEKIMSRGLREVSMREWSWPVRFGSPTERLIYRAGDIGRLWLLYSMQTLVGAVFVTLAAVASLVIFLIEPSIPPLALGTVLVVAVSAHVPTQPIVSRWMSIHMHIIEILRDQAAKASGGRGNSKL